MILFWFYFLVFRLSLYSLPAHKIQHQQQSVNKNNLKVDVTHFYGIHLAMLKKKQFFIVLLALIQTPANKSKQIT